MVKMDTFSTPGIYSIADLFHCSKSDEKSGNLFDDRLFIGERVNYNAKLFQHPHRMDGVVLLICRKGWLNGSVNLMPHRIEEGMLASTCCSSGRKVTISKRVRSYFLRSSSKRCIST